MAKKVEKETNDTAVITEAGEATDKAVGTNDLKMVDGVEVEPKPKAQRYFTTREEAESVEPMRVCTVCGENPRWVVQKRDTKLFWHWSKYRSCENDRQKANRAKRKARITSLTEVVSAKPAAILAKYDVESVGELMKSQLDMTHIKGFSPKSQAALTEFMVAHKLA